MKQIEEEFRDVFNRAARKAATVAMRSLPESNSAKVNRSNLVVHDQTDNPPIGLLYIEEMTT